MNPEEGQFDDSDRNRSATWPLLPLAWKQGPRTPTDEDAVAS